MLPEVMRPPALSCSTSNPGGIVSQQMRPLVGMSGLERLHQRRHREEVVAANIEDELRIRKIAVEVHEVVDLRDGEVDAAVERVVVGAALPGRKDVGLRRRRLV
jgi:hypothetical protein